MTDLEKEFEKQIGLEKIKVCLVVCAVLGVILGFSSIWFYTRVDSLQNQMDTLETDKSSLQSQMNTLLAEKSSLESVVTGLETQLSDLESDKSTLESQVTTLESDKSTLESQVTTLEAQISNLQNEMNSLNSEYDNYVADHQYANWEYELARFDFYYVVPDEQKFGVYDLEDDLYGLEWLHPYEENVFDCSEMSAYLEWYLESLGWNAIIILGDAPFGGGYHAWLLVETSTDHYMPVESTTIEIVWWADPYFDNYFIYDYELETILDALAYYETDFDWWE